MKMLWNSLRFRFGQSRQRAVASSISAMSYLQMLAFRPLPRSPCGGTVATRAVTTDIPPGPAGRNQRLAHECETHVIVLAAALASLDDRCIAVGARTGAPAPRHQVRHRSGRQEDDEGRRQRSGETRLLPRHLASDVARTADSTAHQPCGIVLLTRAFQACRFHAARPSARAARACDTRVDVTRSSPARRASRSAAIAQPLGRRDAHQHGLRLDQARRAAACASSSQGSSVVQPRRRRLDPVECRCQRQDVEQRVEQRVADFLHDDRSRRRSP